MTQKYHINKKGVPSLCKATKGKCPFGGENSHYDSFAEAFAVEEAARSLENGILPSLKKKKDRKGNRITFAYSEESLRYVRSKLKRLAREDTEKDRYISRCSSVERITHFRGSEKTHHFVFDRKERAEGIEEEFGHAKKIGTYKVNHKTDENYRTQIVELFDNGKMKIYDSDTKRLITTFIAHKQRTEVMLLKAGEIPEENFLREIDANRTVAFSKNLNSWLV